MEREQELLNLFPAHSRRFWEPVAEQMDRLQEIRLRVNKPVFVKLENCEYLMDRRGNPGCSVEDAYCISQAEMEELLNHICSYSLYAYENELKQGYLTVQGGHRVGVAGEIILENGSVKNMKYISCMNIRIAHEIIGAADRIMARLYEDRELQNCLIISPPGGGKTTLLRDIIRQVSNGNAYGKGLNVAVVDERSEIGGSYLGIVQNDVGVRTDLLDSCPKAEGMMMLIRSMAPGMLAVDELGGTSDIEALEQVLQCGCRVIATVHGSSLEEIKKKEGMRRLLDQRVFKRYLLLGNREQVGRILRIYDESGRIC